MLLRTIRVYIKKSYYIENHCVNTPANFHFSNKILYVLYSAVIHILVLRNTRAETSCIRNVRNNGKLRMYIETNLRSSVLITQYVTLSYQCYFHILRRCWGDNEINQMIYLLLTNSQEEKKGWNPASHMQQCNLVVDYFLRIFDMIGRILKTYVLLANTKWNFYYSVVYICFLIWYICRINYALFLRVKNSLALVLKTYYISWLNKFSLLRGIYFTNECGSI